jgi:hypothetical protein
MQTDELLKKTLMDVVSLSLDQGMKMPLMVCMMSRNGSVIVVRCVPDREEPVVLTEHSHDGRFVSPIGILVLDQGGQTLKLGVGDRDQVTPDAG